MAWRNQEQPTNVHGMSRSTNSFRSDPRWSIGALADEFVVVEQTTIFKSVMEKLGYHKLCAR